MVKSVKNTKRINISLNNSLYNKIEKKRKMIPRSRFLADIIEKILNKKNRR